MNSEQKATTKVFFDLDFIAQMHNTIYADNYAAIERGIFVQAAANLVAKQTDFNELFSNLDIDHFAGTKEPTLEPTDFTLEELRAQLLEDILEERDVEEQNGELFTCGGEAHAEPHMLPRMQEILASDEKWFLFYHSFDDDPLPRNVSLDKLERDGDFVSPERVRALIFDSDTWCVRQIAYYPEGVSAFHRAWWQWFHNCCSAKRDGASVPAAGFSDGVSVSKDRAVRGAVCATLLIREIVGRAAYTPDL